MYCPEHGSKLIKVAQGLIRKESLVWRIEKDDNTVEDWAKAWRSIVSEQVKKWTENWRKQDNEWASYGDRPQTTISFYACLKCKALLVCVKTRTVLVIEKIGFLTDEMLSAIVSSEIEVGET